MSATIPSQWNVLHSLTLVPSANKTRQCSLASHDIIPVVVVRLRQLLLKPIPYPYTASYSRGLVHILCPVVVVASSPPAEPQPSSQSSRPTGFARLDIHTAFITAAVWPSVAVKTASPRPLVYRSRLPRVIKTFRHSSSWCFVVRSLTLLSVLSVLTFFNENRPACTAS